MKYPYYRIFLFFLLFLGQSKSLIAQGKIRINIPINWSNEENSKNNETSIFPPLFEGAQYSDNNPIPKLVHKIKIPKSDLANVSILDINKAELQKKLFDPTWHVPNQIDIHTAIEKEKNNYYLNLIFPPIILENSQYFKITGINIEIKLDSYQITEKRDAEFADISNLADGNIFKFAVEESGIHKITYEQLSNIEGFPLDFNPNNLQLFGNPGGPNPEAIKDPRYDDLIENAIFISGSDDGTFDNGDYIIFYGHGPDHKMVNEVGEIIHKENIYDDHNYYFLKIGEAPGLRVKTRENTNQNVEKSTISDESIRYEKDYYNLLNDFESTQGSGQLWFSEKYSSGNNQDFSSFFKDENLNTSYPVNFQYQFAGRGASRSSANLKIDNVNHSLSFSSVSISNIESRYADLDRTSFTQELKNNNPSVILEFNGLGATGWLDYIQMTYRKNIVYNGQPISFRNFESANESKFGFEIISNEPDLNIWDITHPEAIFSQSYEQLNNKVSFSYTSSGIHEFVAFNVNDISLSPEFMEQIDNQNLHGIFEADLAIIYYDEFKEQAERLAEHRREHNNYNVALTPVSSVYNEFSSGKVDPTAIRNFARMLYTRDEDFNYLLLFGDGSFDYKHIRPNEYGNQNFIPVFETKESLSPINAFPTDDYYALLDENEGDNLIGQLDIAVGRLTVRSEDEARKVVDKLINYDNNPETYGDWRLRVGFASDDEDWNLHFRDADFIAEKVRSKYTDFNLEKIYFDAFPQISTPGGERYPDATERLDQNIYKGMLTLCYLGHGGPKGWAQERVLKIDDIENWDNANKNPLIVSATCSFTGFDDPKITSAGEISFLKEKTGAIGLFTTVRSVYANQNKRLTEAVFDTIFSRVEGNYLPIGEILRRAKNSNSADTVNVNARKFLLVGDPSMKLALPQNKVSITSFNGQEINSAYNPDTIKALQKIEFEGYVSDPSGNILSDFDGNVFCSVFDKAVNAKTLGNNANSTPTDFKIQNTVLFKGKAKAQNGNFRFEFYIPSDINFEIGNGKISLYAENSQLDAKGMFENFFIGGSEESGKDDTPPLVQVFLNNEQFKSGGISDANPILFVKLFDDYGINVSGVSIGHDLTAELDGDSKKRYVLNDFYESEANDFRYGSLRFPLNNLELGHHTIKVKAWDLSNNPGEGYLDFIVIEDPNISLVNVLNYPNPFTNSTNFQFEHNLPNTPLEINIDIYDIQGKLIQSLYYETPDGGYRIDDINWDLTDGYNAGISNGVYLFKVRLSAPNEGIFKESEFEKMIILR